MAESRGRRLDQPRSNRRFAVEIDPEAFGRFSENLARFMGTGKFLFWQTLLVMTWVSLNLAAVSLRWDRYPFILLNLVFSTQAAYAAPLILLAQNRQDDRDRITLDEDRSRAAQTKADTEFLARELASLRVAIGEIATRDYLRGEIDRLRTDLEDLAAGKPKREKPSAKSGKSSGKQVIAARPNAARAAAISRTTTDHREAGGDTLGSDSGAAQGSDHGADHRADGAS